MHSHSWYVIGHVPAEKVVLTTNKFRFVEKEKNIEKYAIDFSFTPFVYFLKQNNFEEKSSGGTREEMYEGVFEKNKVSFRIICSANPSELLFIEFDKKHRQDIEKLFNVKLVGIKNK